jgi:hypothetical protein
MRSDAIMDIFARLEALDVDPQAKKAFRQLVVNVGHAHCIADVGRIERIEHAQRLLRLNVSRPTIRDRLIAHYSVSRRQAYRLIDEALQLCQKTPSIGTRG